jgi:outer membrane protein assembly factor BamB
LKWKKSLTTDFGGKYGEWAYSESPLVDGDVVVCTPGGSEATIVALNKNSGEVIWKCATEEGDEAGYSSVIAIELEGRKQYVQFLAKGLVGVDAQTGELLWRYGRTAESSPANIPTPVADRGYVYSATGRGGGGLVELKTEEGKIDAVQVYFSPRLPTGIGGTILLGDDLYGTNGEVLQCVEFTTGEVKWQDRSIGASSLCFADGHFYLHGETDGDVALVEATPEGYREKGRFTPPNLPEDGTGKAWPYPVVANGRLYIRHLDSLWCFDVAAK